MLDEVLSLAGVKRVVWIDDCFDEQRVDETYFTELLATACINHATPRHARLANLAGIDDVDTWTASAGMLSRLAQDERNEVVVELRGLAEAAGENDYTYGDLQSLRSALNGPTCLGYKQWTSNRDDPSLALGEDTLVLIDRQILVDGTALPLGEDELREVLRRAPKALVVVLTHSISDEGTEDFRIDLAQRLAIEASSFAVMAKQAGAAEAVGHLGTSLRTVITHRMCEKLIRDVGKSLTDAVQASVSELLGHSIVDLDRAVFQNSRTEGASELDVVVRILSLRARVLSEEQRYAALAAHTTEIGRLRQVHDLAKPTVSRRTTSQLLSWQRDEVYDPANRVNPVLLPLSSGDVFEADGAANQQKTMFVLLGPPCDLAIRSNGKRQAREAWFVRLRPTRAKDEEGRAKERWQEVPSFEGDASSWWLDHFTSCSVALRYLDYAAFNVEGNLSLSLAQSEEALLLPGWRLRMKDAKKELGKVLQGKNPQSTSPFVLSVSDRLGARRSSRMDVSAKTVSFPFRRIARLRQPYARAAFDGLAAFHLRPAYDFRFASGTGDASLADDDDATAVAVEADREEGSDVD